MKEENNRNGSVGGYRPSLNFYHANPKGTGSALSMELHPAHDQVEGSLMVKIANQSSVGNRQGPNPTYPRFDWEGAVTVKLGFSDICKLLQVLRGECESIEDGRGLYHRSGKATTRICFRHLVEGFTGYSLECYRTSLNGEDERRVHFLFGVAEALGVCEAIAGSLSVICFGIPMVIARSPVVESAKSGGACDAAA